MNDMIEQLKPRGEQLTQEESSAMLAAVMSAPRLRARHQRAYVLAAAGVLIVGVATAVWGQRFLTESGQERHGTTTASCVAQLRLDGVVYDGWTYVERTKGQQVGLAELASCDDVGPESRGTYFPNAPRRVEVWSLPPVESTQAVGVVEHRGFTVYIAHGMSGKERQRVLDRLGLAE